MTSSAPLVPQPSPPSTSPKDLYVFMTRVNPETNTHRWYSVTIQKDMFGRLSLITAWGSLKSAYYKQQIKHLHTLEQAHTKAHKIINAKLKKGYTIKHPSEGGAPSPIAPTTPQTAPAANKTESS